MIEPEMMLGEIGSLLSNPMHFVAKILARIMPTTPPIMTIDHLLDVFAIAAIVKLDAEPISIRKQIATVRKNSSIILLHHLSFSS